MSVRVFVRVVCLCGVCVCVCVFISGFSIRFLKLAQIKL